MKAGRGEVSRFRPGPNPNHEGLKDMIRADSVHSTPSLNTSATPIAGLDWLDIAADAKPADMFRAIGKLRKEAREEIDRLIRFLDETENHMCVDDEDGGDEEPDTHDEPSLGFLEMTNHERIAEVGTDYWSIDRDSTPPTTSPRLAASTTTAAKSIGLRVAVVTWRSRHRRSRWAA